MGKSAKLTKVAAPKKKTDPNKGLMSPSASILGRGKGGIAKQRKEKGSGVGGKHAGKFVLSSSKQPRPRT